MTRPSKILGNGLTAIETSSVDGLNVVELREMAEGFRDATHSAAALGVGALGQASRDAVEICERIVSMAQGKRPYPADSAADLAAKFLDWHNHARAFIEKGQADRAALAAWHAATLFARADAKWGFERDWQKGRDLSANARRGNEIAHGTEAQKHARWVKMQRDLEIELAQGTKLTAARRLVAERHKVSEKTIQRLPTYLRKS